MTILIGKMRELRGMTIRKLAEETGISRSTLHDYELGKRSPRLDKLVIIAEVLRCDAADLYDIKHK